jgi:hypothetical protein
MKKTRVKKSCAICPFKAGFFHNLDKYSGYCPPMHSFRTNCQFTHCIFSAWNMNAFKNQCLFLQMFMCTCVCLCPYMLTFNWELVEYQIPAGDHTCTHEPWRLNPPPPGRRYLCITNLNSLAHRHIRCISMDSERLFRREIKQLKKIVPLLL